MGIRMTTKLDEIHKVLMKEANRVERLTIRALSYLGEQCDSRVRDREDNKSWYDQSGNLRSSVGYVIAYNGNIIQYSDFKQIKQGSEGVSVGKNLAKGLVRRYPNDYVLVIVAGMNYAEYVERKDNKDVLASTELWAMDQVPKMLEKLKRQIAK